MSPKPRFKIVREGHVKGAHCAVLPLTYRGLIHEAGYVEELKERIDFLDENGIPAVYAVGTGQMKPENVVLNLEKISTKLEKMSGGPVELIAKPKLYDAVDTALEFTGTYAEQGYV